MRKVLFLLLLSSAFAYSAGDSTFKQMTPEELVAAVRKMTWRTHSTAAKERHNFIKCGVPILKQLAESAPSLDAETRKQLNELGIDTERPMAGFGRPEGLEWHYDTGIFRIHYTMKGNHAVDSTDSDSDGIPDMVELMAATAEKTYAVEIGEHGYTRPPSDRWYSDNGGSDAYDIYILDLGDLLYGFTQFEYLANLSGNNEFSEAKEEYAATSYIVMNSNYSSFLCEEAACVQVTFAHEFFHAIQFGYDAWDRIWFLEASAVWMEDEVYNDINDNYYFLELWMKQPHVALDYSRAPHWYGSWIFFRYLSEHLGGPATIRKMFEQSVENVTKDESDNTIYTIDQVLRRRGSSFREALNQMAVANHLLTSDSDASDYRYEEGTAYREYGIEPRLDRTVTLNGAGAIVEYTGNELMHNATHYIGFTLPEGAIEMNFESFSDSLRYNINGIPESGISFSVYRARGRTIIPIPAGTDMFTVAVVTDTVKNVKYHYRLTVNTDVIIPTAITLSPNFPNPFNVTTTIRFFLPTWEEVALSVVDLKGREVKSVKLGEVQAGYNEVTLEARDLPSGPYIIKLDGETETVARKVMLIK